MRVSVLNIKFLSTLILIGIGFSCHNEIQESKHQSVILIDSDFQMIRSDIQFDGDNLFDLLAKEGLYKRKEGAYLPGDKVGVFQVGSIIWHGSNGAGLISHDQTTGLYTIFNYPDGFIPGFHIRIVYADYDYVFFYHGYEERHIPSLLVYSQKKAEIRKIEKISTSDAQLGKFSWEKLKATKPKANPPAMEWNDTHLKNKLYAVPSEDHLSNPSSIKHSHLHYILNYHEDWGIDDFVTRLYISKADLEKLFH